MTHLTQGAAQVIAGDITSVFRATDEALLCSARVVGSVLEGTARSGMHPRTKQKLLETLGSGFGKLLEGRSDMVRAHGQMFVIQRQSNLETVDFGCWGAPETIFTTATVPEIPTAGADA